MERSLVLMEANVVAVAAGWLRRWLARRAAQRSTAERWPDGRLRAQDRTREPEVLTWWHWSILVLLLVGVLVLVVPSCAGA